MLVVRIVFIYSEDEGGKVPPEVGNHLQDYTAS
jgi:hypothetical protein